MSGGITSWSRPRSKASINYRNPSGPGSSPTRCSRNRPTLFGLCRFSQEKRSERIRRYWECFNLVDDACNDSMAITAFKMGLHPDSPLRSSLTRRPPKIVWVLIKKVEEYCKVTDDALRIKVGQMSNKTAPLEIAQPISSAPPPSPAPR